MKNFNNGIAKCIILIAFLLGFTSCADSPTEVKPLDEATIAVGIGISHDHYVTEHYPNANILRAESMAEVANLVDQQKVDYGVMDLPLALILSSKNPNIKFTDTLFINKIAGGFHKSNHALQREFNAFLKDFVPTDTFKDLFSRWTSGKIVKMPDIETPKDGKKLRVGVCSSSSPFCIVNNNELSGIDVEIMKHFAKARGYVLDFQDMNYGALLNSLTANKIDILLSGLTYTEERAKKILYSDSYLSVPAVVITNIEGKEQYAYLANNDASAEAVPYTDDVLGVSKVVVAVGTTHDMYVSENYPTADIIRVDNIVDVVSMIENDKAEYGIMDRANVILLMSSKNGVEIVNDEVFTSIVGVAFNKEKEELRDEFNAFLKEFRKTDTFKDMDSRWHGDGSGGGISNIEIPKTGKRLAVGCISDSPPAATIVNNKLEGFDIELIRHFAVQRGYELELVSYNFAGMLSAAITGKVDAAISEIAITEERQKNMLFSDPYHDLPVCVFRKRVAPLSKYIDFKMPKVAASAENGVATKMDSIGAVISGKSVGVIEGTVHDMYVLNNFPDVDVQTYKDFADLSQSLMAGKSEFGLYNHIGLRTLQKDNPSLEILFKDFEVDSISFGVSKKNDELLGEINSFMEKYNSDGGIDKIVKKWLDDLGDARIEDIDLRNDNDKTLTVGTAGVSVPFTFVADGKFEGMDIEILSRFCESAGYNLNVVQMPFGSLIAALTTGKIDVIANCLSITEERKKALSFTNPYSNQDFALAVNRSESSSEIQERGFIDEFLTSFDNNIIKEDRYKLILDGLWVTIIISIFSIILGTLLGMIVCFMTMHRSPILRGLARCYITIIRGTPVLVLLMINFYVIFAQSSFSPETVAIISFAVNFAAYVSEMFRTSIQSIDKGQTEAGLAMGFTKIKTFVLIIAPQAITRVLPIFKGESISLVKMTSIVGYIAVQDITKVGDIIRSRTFDAFFPLLVSALLYFLLAYLFTKLLDLLTSKKNR